MFDPTTQKLNVSRHVVFLEHIPFFYFPSSNHDLTIYDLIRIDHFSEDSNDLSSQVPSTSYTPSHVFPHFSLHRTQCVVTNSSAGTYTLLSKTPEAPSSLMVLQALFEIVNPPLH